MLVLKYFKSANACYISHIDWLRHVSRILRRAGIPVNFSQGFNPHALVFFSPPLAVGVPSNAEYLTIDTPMPADEAMSRFNASVSQELQAVKVFECTKNPNLQGKIVAADYVFDTPYRTGNLGEKFEIEYQKKGKTIVEDVADKIYAAFEKDGKQTLRLASGNTNLRPDRLLGKLNKTLGADLTCTDILKVAQYVFIDGKLKNVDDYLCELE